MKIEFKKHSLRVIKEITDKKYYSESKLFYDIKNVLNAKGYDFIKKIMSKDGHLIGGDTYPYYLRERKIKDNKQLCIYDNNYAIRFLFKDWNKTGEICLSVENLVL